MAKGDWEGATAVMDMENTAHNLPVFKGITLEAILSQQNLAEALKRVEANKGAPGVDGMRTDELRDYIYQHPGESRTILRASIRVHDRSRNSVATARTYSHIESPKDQIGRHRSIHGPAQNAAAPKIQNGSQESPSLGRGQVRDVAHPCSVECSGSKIAP